MLVYSDKVFFEVNEDEFIKILNEIESKKKCKNFCNGFIHRYWNEGVIAWWNYCLIALSNSLNIISITLMRIFVHPIKIFM